MKILDCTAIILAGGDSKRMGQDKAALPFDGQTLLQRVIASVQPLFAQTLVSVRQPRADVALQQICDTQADGGPLVGLVSSLQNITTPWAFVVACDMPFVVPGVIEQLAGYRAVHQAVVPVIDGYPQPLAAFYATSALDAMRASLAAGDQSLRGMLQRLDVRYVSEAELRAFDPQLRSFFDLDTPQDVALAEGMKR
ncbi:MAG: molybdenum cofactor guanylyltransferase [Gallionella sp.]|nr:molybdenum cofactor guanylyltransferase [Gallionella sp.]